MTAAEERALAALKSQTNGWHLSADALRRQAPDLIARDRGWHDTMDVWRAREAYQAQGCGWALALLVGGPMILGLALSVGWTILACVRALGF